MQAALAKVDLKQQPDTVAHCAAAGLITRYCSVIEAGMAGVGKEIRDVFSAGDAEWRDLVSDKRGIDCARHASSDQQLWSCCLSTIP